MYNTAARYGRQGISIPAPKISAGYILLLSIIILFFARGIDVLKSNTERGGLAYVKLLNFSMPMVETQVYNEADYVESTLSLKSVVMQIFALDKLSGLDIVAKELPIYETPDNKEKSKLSGRTYNPFVMNEDNIDKVEENKNNPAYSPALKKELDKSKPEILIYHTHTTEAYAEAGTDSTNNKYNVVGVGEALTKELEENYGIAVVHDTTNNSTDYNEAYTKSRETVKRNLNEYGDFKIVVDLHRDAAKDKSTVTTNMNGEDLAKMMFVIAENSERYPKNKEILDSLYSIGNKLFPGFVRETTVYPIGKGAFNQDLSDNSVLIECGTQLNTSEEVNRTAKYIARILAEYLNKN